MGESRRPSAEVRYFVERRIRDLLRELGLARLPDRDVGQHPRPPTRARGERGREIVACFPANRPQSCERTGFAADVSVSRVPPATTA